MATNRPDTPSLAYYWKQIGGHIHVRVFSGPLGHTRGKVGDLIFSVEEWPDVKMVLTHAVNTAIEIREDE